MFCPYCGKETADGSVFCGHCGKNLEELIEKKNEQPENTVLALTIRDSQREEEDTRAAQGKMESIFHDAIQKAKEHSEILIAVIAVIIFAVFVTTYMPGVDFDVTKNLGTYGLEETFEVEDVAFMFNEYYESDSVTLGYWSRIESPVEGTIVCGIGGLIENRGSSYADLTKLSAVISCEDDSGNKAQGDVTAKVYDATGMINGTQLYTLAPNQQAYIYLIASPKTGYHLVKAEIIAEEDFTDNEKSYSVNIVPETETDDQSEAEST